MDKPKVPWNTRLGTVGESAVKTHLAYFSIPTKYETDPGLDFYCELIENDSPSNHFYVQAKGTEHFDSAWGKSIAKSTLRYWLEQDSPVFLIVYDENNGHRYWTSIEDIRYELIRSIFSTKSKTVYIKVSKSNILEKGKTANEPFIRKVKEDQISIGLFRGQPQFIGEQYVKNIPPPPRTQGELLRLKDNVRAGLYSLIRYYGIINDFEMAEKCCLFLVEFDKDHFNHFQWFGQILKRRGEKEKAKKYFNEALKICLADKEWPKESMDPIIESIKKDMEGL